MSNTVSISHSNSSLWVQGWKFRLHRVGRIMLGKETFFYNGDAFRSLRIYILWLHSPNLEKTILKVAFFIFWPEQEQQSWSLWTKAPHSKILRDCPFPLCWPTLGRLSLYQGLKIDFAEGEGWSLSHKSRTSALVGVSCTQKPALVFNSSCCSFLALMSSAKIALFSSALIALGSRYTEPAVSLFDKMTQPIPLL